MKNSNDIVSILELADMGGFTHFIKWTSKRYIVAFTHFEFQEWETIQEISEKLFTFSNWLAQNMDSLTIWGWRDPVSQRLYIDFWIATDERDFALTMGRAFAQISIWDNEVCDTITL